MHRSLPPLALLLIAPTAFAQETVQKRLTISPTQQSVQTAPATTAVTTTTTVVTTPPATAGPTAQSVAADAVNTAATTNAEQATTLLNHLRQGLAAYTNDAQVSVNMDRIRVRLQHTDDLDSGTLGSPNHEIVDRIAAELSQNPGWNVEVQGHSSTAPENADEERIAQQRADPIVRELAEHLPNHSVTSRSMGSEHPMETNSTPEGQALNDRVEVWIMPPGYPHSPTNLFPAGEDEER